MIAVAISLLFGLALFAALAAIHGSLAHGAYRARQILAELAALEGSKAPLSRGSRAAPARFAAA